MTEDVKTVKLTKAQADALRDVVSGSPLCLTKGDESIMKALARQGLVSWSVPQFGHLNGRHEWKATDLGRTHPAVTTA